MFFRREKLQKPSISQRIDALRQAGFTAAAGPTGAVRVTRGVYAVDLRETEGVLLREGRAGILIGGEIGCLVDNGFQKFFRTPTGAQKPALAEQLKALHDFEEDVKEALGQDSYYNESLGTVSTFYLYDRVANRDAGVPKRVWET
jgi:hypothetical protein